MWSNISEDGSSSQERGWRLFLSVNAIAIAVVGVLCNSTLIVIFLQTKSLRTPTNAFMVSLAFGEILIGLFHVPFVASSLLANGWPFSRTLCCATGSLQVIGRTVATLSLMSVCIDRCVAVSRPLVYSHIVNFKFAASMISALWLLSLILGLLPLGSWGSYRYSGMFSACIMKSTYGRDERVVKESICTLVPCFIIFICLMMIIKEVKYHHRIFALFPVPSAQIITGIEATPTPSILPEMRSFNRNTLKALRPLFVMCVCYSLFCLPATALSLAAEKENFPGSHPGYCIVVWLSFLCSILNPSIVILFKQKFRAKIKSILCSSIRFRPTRPSKEPFTISSGLQGILTETTLIGSMVKTTSKATAVTASRGQSVRVDSNYR